MTFFPSRIFREKMLQLMEFSSKCKDCNAVPNASCSSITLLWKKNQSLCYLYF